MVGIQRPSKICWGRFKVSTYLSKMGTGLLKVNFQNSAFPRPQLIQSASFLLVGCFVISWYISYYDCQALSEMSTHVFKMVNYTVKVVLNRRRRSKTFRIVSLFDQIATQLPIYKRNKILAVVWPIGLVDNTFDRCNETKWQFKSDIWILSISDHKKDKKSRNLGSGDIGDKCQYDKRPGLVIPFSINLPLYLGIPPF